ncbi:pectin lyase fold/virulence factor, partial [Protomyces lactucae-debilis]
DDAIALKQTNGATFECLNIFYSHGLSIGSVSEGNVVQNVVFKDIELTAPEYAVRIKAKKFSTGLVQNVYYTNILAHQANVTAIGIRDDYLDPDADFKPDSDVMIKGIHFTDFTAT